MELTPAPESLFWYWVQERHAIYIRRATGQPKPWTADWILQQYKFTNVFRQLDRGTVWLTQNFVQPHTDDDMALLAGNIFWYRMFNWTGTGALLGWQKRWNPKQLRARLTKAQKRGDQIFTGAHIIWGEFGKSKIDGVLECCGRLWQRKSYIVKTARFTRSLESTFRELASVRGVGGFMGYEMVTDLRWTPILSDARDINAWANVGPGAFRGLRRIWPELKYKDALPRMRELLSRSTENLTADFPAIELRDIEHSLCEYDKYCRVKFGEGRPRSTYPGTAADGVAG